MLDSRSILAQIECVTTRWKALIELYTTNQKTDYMGPWLERKTALETVVQNIVETLIPFFSHTICLFSMKFSQLNHIYITYNLYKIHALRSCV